MRAHLAWLTTAAVTLAAAPALAQQPQVVVITQPPPVAVPLEPPSTGAGLIIAGSIFTGVGGVNLITAPLCKTSMIHQPNIQNVCLVTSLVLGGTFAAIGIPLLVVGVGRRAEYREWKRQHGILAKLTDIGVAPQPGGAALTWQTSF